MLPIKGADGYCVPNFWKGEILMANENLIDECPLGGDITDDCADCFYAGDYHFVDGECIRREEVTEDGK